MSDAESRRTVRWQRLDRPGIERATLWSSKGRWNLDARIETDLVGGRSRIRYRVQIPVDDAGLVLEYPDLWARAPNP